MTIIDRNDNTDSNRGLMPGHDVGMALVDMDEDFTETPRSFDVDLKELNEEAIELAVQTARNFEELGV